MTATPHRTPERRFHDVSNALQVVQGAVSALDLYDADLTASDKAKLEAAITAAMDELETLLDLDEDAGPQHGLPRSLDQAIADARARDVDVSLDAADVPALRWDGDELRGLLGELFVALGSGARAVVRPTHAGEHVVLEVFRHRPDGQVRRLLLRVRSA